MKTFRQEKILLTMEVKVRHLNLSIFQEPNLHENCKGNSKCGRMLRIAVIIKYHQLLVNKGDATNARAILQEFVDATYSRSLLLEDYIDFFSSHSDSASRGALGGWLRTLQCSCSSVAKCTGTARHFRGRTQRDEQGLFLDLIDTLHFNIFHLEHVGLRVPVHDNQDVDEDDKDDDDLIDTI